MTGTAIKINDGDTFVFLNQSTGEKFKVRLFGIDAPEKGQTCGTEAFQVLYEEIFYKKVTIHYEDNKNGFPKTDKYGRIIAIVEVDNKDINRYMVQEGLAWSYKYFSHKYIDDEAIARKNKKGIWSYPNQIEPYMFRKQGKGKF